MKKKHHEKKQERMKSKRKVQEKVEDIKYRGAIPDEVLDEMTPEIIEQYFLWDEVIKREIELHPWLMLPLIREVFHKTYPKGIRIRLVATEYVVRRIHKEKGSTLNSIYADIAVQIGSRDIYHLECQMNKDNDMILRMLEYDIHIGLAHEAQYLSKKASAVIKSEMQMPRSVILYLNHLDNMPSEEKCLIRFADGTTHEYCVPVMKVQNYTIEMIEEKHLSILIPFLPIRFKKYFSEKKEGEKKSVSESVKKHLTEFIRKCIIIIDREKENGTLTDTAGKDIVEFLSITCSHLLKNEPELSEEVQKIMKPTIKLTREILGEEISELKNLVKLEREKAAEEIEKIQLEREKAAEEAKQMKNLVKLEREKAAEEVRQIKGEIKKSVDEQERSIKKLIIRNQQNGQTRQEVKEYIQDIFSLSEEKAEEKMKQYWKN